MVDREGDGDDGQRADAVPNEMPNNCHMATELIPKEMENDKPCVLNGITKNCRDNYQEIITEILQRQISLPKDSHGDQTRGLRGAQPDKPTDGDVYRTRYRTECRTILPEVYQMTTEKPTDILPKVPTGMPTKNSTKNAPKPKKDSLQTKLKPNRITCQITERLRLRS